MVCGLARVPRPFADLAVAHGDTRYGRLLRSIARAKLLILDDWGPEQLSSDQGRDLLEIVEDRYDAGSIVITSQLPVDRWHDMITAWALAASVPMSPFFWPREFAAFLGLVVKNLTLGTHPKL